MNGKLSDTQRKPSSPLNCPELMMREFRAGQSICAQVVFHFRNVFQSLEFDVIDNNTKKPTGQKIKCEKPIHVIFEGADLDVYKYLPSSEIKLDLSDIKESFCFLFVGRPTSTTRKRARGRVTRDS